ncbi:hypothetical protein KC19_10G187500 [Ceratodon purpureus]|uniref:Secreted protein n=1 Tax=Ceratodon purpureus TaxID=3225 RepID=A0A8T0GQF6_CERPU|nr:hypothetical protein KC19_10G187500 [Ceratodon purpureus]
MLVKPGCSIRCPLLLHYWCSIVAARAQAPPPESESAASCCSACLQHLQELSLLQNHRNSID